MCFILIFHIHDSIIQLQNILTLEREQNYVSVSQLETDTMSAL